jgi:hypothetical protein
MGQHNELGQRIHGAGAFNAEAPCQARQQHVGQHWMVLDEVGIRSLTALYRKRDVQVFGLVVVQQHVVLGEDGVDQRE